MDADYFLKSLRIFNHNFSQMDTNQSSLAAGKSNASDYVFHSCKSVKISG